MDRHAFDAVVIGAGIAGATAAAHLAATHHVALLEAEENAGYHATGRSAAIWIRNYGGADVRILTAASRDFFEAPPAGFAEAPLAHPRPVVHLAPPEPIGLQPKRRTACIIDPGPHDCGDWPLLGDAGHGWYVRPEARRKLMVSPADETDSDPCDAQPDEYDVAIAIDRMQQALDIPVSRIEHRWAGLRSFTPDRALAIGQGAEAGFFWMVGQGGYGMQTAPAAGRLLAALVARQDPGALAAAVPLCDPLRFARMAIA